MGVLRYLIALGLVLLLGLATVREQVRAMRAGYRIQELERRKEQLVEMRRRLEVQKEREARPDLLVGRATKMGMPIPAAPRSLPAARSLAAPPFGESGSVEVTPVE